MQRVEHECLSLTGRETRSSELSRVGGARNVVSREPNRIEAAQVAEVTTHLCLCSITKYCFAIPVAHSLLNVSMMAATSYKSSISVWNGKDKTTENDFDDLNPTITYRHLFSQSLGVKDPLRVIALCDSDAFYAACEQVRLGIDPALPLVVQQWDSLIAVNYPARKFGISRMDKIKDARNRCPELVVVHVATYKEGEKEPGYWDNPDTLTHKVSSFYDLLWLHKCSSVPWY